MVDHLSLSNLLRLLVFNPKDVYSRYAYTAPDDLKISLSQHMELAENTSQRSKAEVVRQLCERAERFRTLNHYREAIEVAAEASHIAHSAYDHNLQGVALLYLGTARISAGKTDLDRQAISDCNRAIRDFCLESHNYAVALIIRAQMQLQIHRNDDNEITLSYLRKASRSLEKILIEFHAQNMALTVEDYQKLKHDVDVMINDLVRSRTEIKPQPIIPKQAIRSAAPQDKLIDAFSSSVRALARRSIPIFSVSARAGSAEGEFADESIDDYIEIADQLMVQGRPYFLQWADDKKRVRHAFQLRGDRNYVVVLVEGRSMQPTLQPNEYVLVRKQNYHDFDGQLVVAALGEQNESNPIQHIVKRARGYPNIQQLASDNPDKASYPPIIPNESDIQVSLLGVVEAILTPCGSA